MKLGTNSINNIVLAVGAIFLLWLLLLPKPGPEWNYFDTVKYASATLKGQTPYSDFAAMVVGFRALYNDTDPYPILGKAFKDLGIEWDVIHPSNHPPTSYLLAAPVAFFSWPVASAIWAWLMLALIVFSYRCYGLSWRLSLGLTPLTMLWPPASASLGQVTIVWMFGIALAYYFRKSHLFWSGASLGIASLSKYMPGLLIVIFAVKRKWMAVLGCAAVWVVSLAAVLLLNPQAIGRYVEASRSTYSFLVQRTDNSALLSVSYNYGGWLGLAALILFFAAIVYLNRRHFLEWESYPSTRLWMLVSYLAVACLPIFWIYSLMPLLPVIIYLLWQKRIAITAICLYCIVVPSIYIRGGEQSVPFIASVCVLCGVAFILDTLSLKVFQQEWRLDLLRSRS